LFGFIQKIKFELVMGKSPFKMNHQKLRCFGVGLMAESAAQALLENASVEPLTDIGSCKKPVQE
jgi:hypothetical protein